MSQILESDRSAVILSRLYNPPGTVDLENIRKLPVDLQAVAWQVVGEGSDLAMREARLRAELVARGDFEILVALDSANLNLDLDQLPSAGRWDLLGLEDAFRPLEPLRWVVEGLISEESLSIWFGAPKGFKSLLLSDLALSVAAGQNWLGSPPGGTGGFPTVALPVLWVDLENGKRRMAERFAALGRARGMKGNEPVHWLTMPSPWLDASTPETVGLLGEAVEKTRARLVVVDHLSQALGEVEENSAGMGEVMSAFRGVAEAYGAAVVLIHHVVKGAGRYGISGSDSLRGHSSILASVDLAALVERDPFSKGGVLVKPVACRGPSLDTFGAEFAFELKADGSRELSTCRFWGNLAEAASVKIARVVIEILSEGGKTLNQTALRKAVKEKFPAALDDEVRAVLASMELSGEVEVKVGKQNSKNYSIPV